MTITKGAITRREFIKYAAIAGGGLGVVVLGNKLAWLQTSRTFAAAAIPTLNLTVTDAIKGMVTDNTVNTAKCYFWVYKSDYNTVDGSGINYPAECPGPVIVAQNGQSVTIKVTNTLNENHAFTIPGLPVSAGSADTGAIAPGASATITFTPSAAGAWLYYDNLNPPVNRMMGLHGAIIVMPIEADRAVGHNLTPYSSPGQHQQDLYDAFGTATFPGLKWEEGDTTNWALAPAGEHIDNCPPFRQYVWIEHEASSRLFAEVGVYPAGDYPAADFVNKFLKSTSITTRSVNSLSEIGGIPLGTIPGFVDASGNPIPVSASYTPDYFMINGQSGMLSHFNPTITPIGRVGEPVVIHICNAGLWTHSSHLHANHFYVTSVNHLQVNPIWVDVYNIEPMDAIDYTIPYMRPPDLPNITGIGRAVTPLNTIAGHKVWPPLQEMNTWMPGLSVHAPTPAFGMPVFHQASGDNGTDAAGNPVELGQRMSPLCYPMHDHSEPSQTAQGGNYNCGLISGIYFTGDRNTAGFMDFPMDEDFHGAYMNIRGVQATKPAAPPMGM